MSGAAALMGGNTPAANGYTGTAPAQPVQVAQSGPTYPGSFAPNMPPRAGPLGAMPQQFPGLPAPPPGQQYNPADLQRYVAHLRLQDQMNAALGRRNPVSVEEGLKMAPGGSMSPGYIGEA